MMRFGPVAAARVKRDEKGRYAVEEAVAF